MERGFVDPVEAAIETLLADAELQLGNRARLLLKEAVRLQSEPAAQTFLPGLTVPPTVQGRYPGPLISFEGMDGVGKSTVIDGVASALAGTGVEVVRMREPGGTPAGERIREILLHKLDFEISPRTEAALFAAQRAENAAQIIRPALERGAAVLSDRFVHSSIAYQGVARGLGAEPIADLNRFALDGIWPTRTLMLVLTPEAAERRRGERRRLEEQRSSETERRQGDRRPTSSHDRIERAGDDFQRLVAAGFAYCLEHDPVVVAVDADGSPEEVVARALAALSGLV